MFNIQEDNTLPMKDTQLLFHLQIHLKHSNEHQYPFHGKKYYTGYTGGPLKYLDTWEQATSKFNRLAEKGEYLLSEHLIQILGMKFKVINDTEALFEQTKGEANNFDKLISALRKKLSQREYV